MIKTDFVRAIMKTFLVITIFVAVFAVSSKYQPSLCQHHTAKLIFSTINWSSSYSDAGIVDRIKKMFADSSEEIQTSVHTQQTVTKVETPAMMSPPIQKPATMSPPSYTPQMETETIKTDYTITEKKTSSSSEEKS